MRAAHPDAAHTKTMLNTFYESTWASAKRSLKTVSCCAFTLGLPCAAQAQGTVTISGLIDGGLAYVDDFGGSRGTRSLQAKSGDINVNRWTLSGNEPLGPDLSALFVLANGFSVMNGATGQQGRMFGFQSYAGLASHASGTVTFGRQFDSMLQFVQPFALGGTPYGGVAFAHPFDNDDLANYTRTNNAVKYTSPMMRGFQFGATYGFSNEAGAFSNNRAFSVAGTYAHGACSAGASYVQFDGESNLATANTQGAEPAGAPFNAARQRTAGLGSACTWDRLHVSAIVTRTQLDNATSINNVADTPIALRGEDIVFRNAELNARYALTNRWTVATAYTFTSGSFASPSGHASPTWHQFGLIGIDALSARTDAYAEAIDQRANGLAGTGIPGAQISNFSHATGPNQLVLALGLRHRF